MCERMILVPESEFQRLLQSVRDPTETPTTVTVTEPAVLDTTVDLAELLPPRLRNSARQLLTAFRQRYTPDQLSWNAKSGEITVRGAVVPNSNITDILYGLLQPFQKAQINGLNQLTTLFRETNFPSLLIRNQKSRQALAAPITEPAIQVPEPIAKKPRVWLKWQN